MIDRLWTLFEYCCDLPIDFVAVSHQHTRLMQVCFKGDLSSGRRVEAYSEVHCFPSLWARIVNGSLCRVSPGHFIVIAQSVNTCGQRTFYQDGIVMVGYA